MPFSKTLLPEFDEEMANTRKILACVPDGKFDYQPHPKSMTLGRLANHVAEMPSWGGTTIDTEVFELGADFKPDVSATREAVLEKFDRGVAETRRKIEATPDNEWEKIWTFRYGGKTLMELPRSQVMRTTVMNHMIHHRAQLGVFLRLLDVAIPGMYGPSADEMKFWEAQAS